MKKIFNAVLNTIMILCFILLMTNYILLSILSFGWWALIVFPGVLIFAVLMLFLFLIGVCYVQDVVQTKSFTNYFKNVLKINK